MRFSTPLVLALPALAAAEQQIPLADKVKGWFNKATASIAAGVPSVHVPNPVDAGAATVAAANVHQLHLENWKGVLSPSPARKASAGPEEWMVYVSGGNKTCYGLCGVADKAWNASTPLLAASRNAPKLASIDCDAEQILCNTWAAGPPSIWHILLPQPLPDQSKPATTVRIIHLNRVNVTATEIAEIHTKKTYAKEKVFEGYFHPFDGLVAKSGLAVPLAYVMWAFAKMPSWLPMIAVSFLSRRFMGNRMRPGQQQGAAAPAPAQ